MFALLFHNTVTPPEYIYIDIRCQGTSGSPAQGAGHMILYGIEGTQNDVDSNVFDSLYYFENNKMTFTTDVEFNHGIDVKNNKIVGVLEGTDDDNAINFKQLNAATTLLSNKITELTTITNTLERQITKVLNTHIITNNYLSFMHLLLTQMNLVVIYKM